MNSSSFESDRLSQFAVEAKDLTKVFGLGRRDVHSLGLRPIDQGEAQRYQPTWPSGFVAVDSLSFSVQKGERVGFLGHNGSGKTTLFQMLAGILQPSQGTVRVHGSIGTLLDPSAGFHPEFSGRENLALAAQVMGLPRSEMDSAIVEAASFSELDLFLDRPLRTYSQGMLLRLAFSLNIMLRPDVLLVDEALAVGDIRFQQKCFELLRSGQAADTLLMISHDLNALASLADRVLVMDHGRLIFDGPTREAISVYLRSLHGQPKTCRPPASPEATGNPPEDESLPWVVPSSLQLTGNGKIGITRLSLLDRQGEYPSIVQAGDELRIELDLDIPEAGMPLIFGYIVHDRLGLDICGQNSFDKTGKPFSVPRSGPYRVSLSFVWPSLKPGSYTITVGVGEGYHSESHEILSWAHHIFQVESFTIGGAVNTLFSNPIQRIALRPRQ